MTINRASRFSFLWLILSMLALPALAQESPADDAATPAEATTATAEEADVLLDKAKKTDSEMVQVVADLKGTEGEDRIILRARFDDLLDQNLAELDQLAKTIAARDKSGKDVTHLRLETEQLLKRSSRRLRTYIQNFQKDLQAQASNRETLGADDIEVFEHQMAVSTNRLDHLYLDLIKLGELKLGAGLQVTDDTEFVERQLGERGQNLIGVMELTKKQLAQYQQMAKRAPDNAQVQSQLFAAEERLDANKTALQATIHMMKSLGMDYADLEVRALELTGEITPEAVSSEVATELAKHKTTQAKNYIKDNGPKLFVRLLVIGGIMLAFWVLARITRRIASKLLTKSKVATSELLKETIIAWTGRLVILFGLIIVLSQLGINPGPLLAGLGIAGFVIGFALQDTLSNFAAGAMILFYQPYDVGDFVEAGGVMGKVRDMNLVSTRILTPDHQTLIVPNSKIWGDVIRNVTSQPTRRVDLVFGISYEDDIAKAESVLADILASNDKVLDDPEPVIKLHNLGDSSVDFVVRPWAKTDDYWDVHWDITRAVKVRFDEEGISIPYPQRDVHLIPASDSEVSADVSGSETA